jgi:hypothetical protein
MDHDPYPPAEFMQEGEPLFDWEEDLMAKRRNVRDDYLASPEPSAALGDNGPRAFSLWERIRRAI